MVVDGVPPEFDRINSICQRRDGFAYFIGKEEQGMGTPAALETGESALVVVRAADFLFPVSFMCACERGLG